MQNGRMYMHYSRRLISISRFSGNACVSKRSILVTYIPILRNYSDIGYNVPFNSLNLNRTVNAAIYTYPDNP